MTQKRNYDLEVTNLLNQFESQNLLVEECTASYMTEINQSIVTLRWVDNTAECNEEENANS